MGRRGVRTISERPDEPSARAQLRRVADGLRWLRFPRVTKLLESAGADLLGMLLAEQDDEQGGTALLQRRVDGPAQGPHEQRGSGSRHC